jgi:hypothetical protein
VRNAMTAKDAAIGKDEASLMRSRLGGRSSRLADASGRGVARVSSSVRRGACNGAGCRSLIFQPKNETSLPDCCHWNRRLYTLILCVELS